MKVIVLITRLIMPGFLLCSTAASGSTNRHHFAYLPDLDNNSSIRATVPNSAFTNAYIYTYIYIKSQMSYSTDF